MKIKSSELKNGITACGKTIIENKLAFIRTIISEDEKELIEEYVKTIEKIKLKNKVLPQIFAFDRRIYMPFILSRALKYTINLQEVLMPLNKWRIEDISEKFGNFNSEYEIYDYLNLNYIKLNKTLKESKEIKEDYKNYILSQIKRVNSLAIVVSKMLNITYQDNFNSKLIVTLETEPIQEKIEEFKLRYNYINSSEEEIKRYMKMNFNYSKLVSISICQLTDVEKKGEENNVV